MRTRSSSACCRIHRVQPSHRHPRPDPPAASPLRARGEDEEAERVAGAVAALLALVTAALVLVGIVLTPWLIAIIAPGFEGEKRAATIRLVRILFPGAGLLVLS